MNRQEVRKIGIYLVTSILFTIALLLIAGRDLLFREIIFALTFIPLLSLAQIHFLFNKHHKPSTILSLLSGSLAGLSFLLLTDHPSSELLIGLIASGGFSLMTLSLIFLRRILPWKWIEIEWGAMFNWSNTTCRYEHGPGTIIFLGSGFCWMRDIGR